MERRAIAAGGNPRHESEWRDSVLAARQRLAVGRLNDIHFACMATIYVYLPNESVDVWRPVSAERVTDSVYIIDPMAEVPEDEEWPFQPGDRVYCEQRRFSDGEGLVALRNAV